MFMPHMERFLAPAFAVSGMTDQSAFVIRNMFDSAFAHLFVAPITAVIVRYHERHGLRDAEIDASADSNGAGFY